MSHPIETYLRGLLEERESIDQLLKRVGREFAEQSAEQLVRPVDFPKLSDAPPDDGLLHWYRVREFPVALCGHVSTFETLAAAQTTPDRRARRICPKCREIDMQRLGVKP